MSTFYDLYETPDPSGEGKKKPLHARVHSKGTITAKEFQERVMKEQHMPHAMIVGIMQAISNALGDWLAEGYNVEFDELGYFSTTLKCTRPAMNKNRIRTVRNGKVPSKQRIKKIREASNAFGKAGQEDGDKETGSSPGKKKRNDAEIPGSKHLHHTHRVLPPDECNGPPRQ